MFRPRNGQYWPNLGQKSKNLKFELGEKLDNRFRVKFHGESSGDSLNALIRCLDSEMGHKGLIILHVPLTRAVSFEFLRSRL